MDTDPSKDNICVNFQTFNPLLCCKQISSKSEIYLRIIAIFFAIIVFTCIIDKSLYEEANERGQPIITCLYDSDSSACNYGIAVGIISLVSNLLFLFIDVIMELINHPVIYRFIALSMLLFNIQWGFNWFVLFCLLVNRWNATSSVVKEIITIISINVIQTAIVFSFFSILIYIGIILFGVRRTYRGPRLATEVDSKPSAFLALVIIFLEKCSNENSESSGKATSNYRAHNVEA